jgi:hypothetical protein
MRVRSPPISGELGDRQQRLGLDVELDHPCLPVLAAADEVVVGDQEADNVGIVQAHDGALEVRSREALVARKGPELLAVDLAVFHPRRWLVHAELHRPGTDGEGVAGARAGAPPGAAAAAVGVDADEPHRASAGGAQALGMLGHVVVLVVVLGVPDHAGGQRSVPFPGARRVGHVAQEEAALVLNPAKEAVADRDDGVGAARPKPLDATFVATVVVNDGHRLNELPLGRAAAGQTELDRVPSRVAVVLEVELDQQDVAVASPEKGRSPAVQEVLVLETVRAALVAHLQEDRVPMGRDDTDAPIVDVVVLIALVVVVLIALVVDAVVLVALVDVVAILLALVAALHARRGIREIVVDKGARRRWRWWPVEVREYATVLASATNHSSARMPHLFSSTQPGSFSAAGGESRGSSRRRPGLVATPADTWGEVDRAQGNYNGVNYNCHSTSEFGSIILTINSLTIFVIIRIEGHWICI